MVTYRKNQAQADAEQAEWLKTAGIEGAMW